MTCIRWDVQRFIGVTPRLMESRDEALQRIARWRELQHPLHGIWAVTSKVTGERFGTLLLKPIPASGDAAPHADEPDDTEIGWHFHPDAWGNGYATEAASVVLEHALAHGLDRVVAVTNPENAASQRVCERIGMTGLGVSDAYYDTMCELFEAVARK